MNTRTHETPPKVTATHEAARHIADLEALLRGQVVT